MSSAAAGMTKDELKSALLDLGVEIPSAQVKKDVLAALYERYVGPVSANRADFSSDEEGEFVVGSKPSKMNSEEKRRKLHKDVMELTDEELFQELQKQGFTLGPIVDSTRMVYRRKLSAILSSQNNGSVEEDEAEKATEPRYEQSSFQNGDFSADDDVSQDDDNDEDDDIEEIEDVTDSSENVASTRVINSGLSSPYTALRQRITDHKVGSDFSSQSFTVTARQSIHSYNKESKTFLSKDEGDDTCGFLHKKTETTSRSLFSSVLRRLFGFVFLLVSIYYGYKVFIVGN